MIDANANRAREALRVMEDYARFKLDDAWLMERVKRLRHGLGEAVGGEWAEFMLRARGIEEDVGREVKTEAELRRGELADVATAAGKRAGEALRVLEECAKLFDAARARRLEKIRYEVYEVERALRIRVTAPARFGSVRLYVLLSEAVCGHGWKETAEAVIAGGADCIQLREKELPDGELLGRARWLAERCRQAGVMFVVNDRADVARLSGADGAHVGQDDVGVADARRIVGPGLLVGVSTHAIEQARRAMAASPDYLAVGPMFASKTKSQGHIAGPELLREVTAETSLPVAAIGGIDAGNVERVVEAGARCVCVCAAVIGQEDVEASAREMKRRVVEAEERFHGDR